MATLRKTSVAKSQHYGQMREMIAGIFQRQLGAPRKNALRVAGRMVRIAKKVEREMQHFELYPREGES